VSATPGAAQAPEGDTGHDIRTNASTIARTLGKARILMEALPYIKEFSGKIVVIKYGGHAMDDPRLRASFADDLVLMLYVGMRPVIVHGGGPQVTAAMERAGLEPVFRDGLRVTDAATLRVARQVLVGEVNRDMVNLINTHGNLAAGLSGEDAGTLRVRTHRPGGADIGYVGEVATVNTELIDSLLARELIPVVATIGVDAEGHPHNVNADTAAGAIAEALRAEKLVYLTDVAGLYRDLSDPHTLISRISVGELGSLGGGLAAGMIPKVASIVAALRNGVHKAHILDGRVEHVVLLEIFTPEGIGTMIAPDAATALREDDT